MKDDHSKIRVRIAPSPTGYFQIGNARTALFNYLFARKNKGDFIVRVEDTDKERSKQEYETAMFESLQWLGFVWDEGPASATKTGEISEAPVGRSGPYRQSERTNIYKDTLESLLSSQRAFYCYHSKEELEEERDSQMLQKLPPVHWCSHKEDQEKFKGKRGVIRLVVKRDESISFIDLVKGSVEVSTNQIGEIIIARSVDEVLYNFAVVVDDIEMNISHVMRGEDHTTNTTKQVAIYNALSKDVPEFVHIPLVLASDRSKMSKRHGSVAIKDFREEGYLPEAIVNYIAFLGWNPKTDQEYFSLNELIQSFDIKGLNTAPAVFDYEKLKNVNSHYIKQLSPSELADKVIPFLDKDEIQYTRDVLEKAVVLEQSRSKTLSEFPDALRFFFELPKFERNMLQWKKMESIDQVVQSLQDSLEIIESCSEDEVANGTAGNNLMEKAEEIGDRGWLLWPLRVALSGKQHSPGPTDILQILGREESINRLNSALSR